MSDELRFGERVPEWGGAMLDPEAPCALSLICEICDERVTVQLRGLYQVNVWTPCPNPSRRAPHGWRPGEPARFTDTKEE